MALGFPLWLFTFFALALRGLMLVSGELNDHGPIEFQSPTAGQTMAIAGAIILYCLAYPAAFFLAHRVTRHPWAVFLVMLAPVLVFCLAVDNWNITNSNSEQTWGLLYFGSLSAVLFLGCVVGFLVERGHPPLDATYS